MKCRRRSKTMSVSILMVLVMLVSVIQTIGIPVDAAAQGQLRAAAADDTLSTAQTGDPSSSASADYDGTVYSLESGVSLKLPSNFTQNAVWDTMDDTATGIKAQGYTNAEAAVEKIKSFGSELLTYRDGDSQSVGYSIFVAVQDTPDDLSNESLFSSIFDWLGYYDPASAPVYGYGTDTVNGFSLFKTYAETPNSKDYMYNYILVTDTGTMYHVNLWNHGLEPTEPTDGYMDSLAQNVISSMTLSDDLRSHVVTLEGEPFKMIEGEHAGAYTKTDSAQTVLTTTAAAKPAVQKKPLYQRIIAFEFPIVLILIALILILVVGAKLPGKAKWHEEPLSLGNAKAIQGFCAVAIIIHHLAQDLMEGAGVLSFFSELGVLFVGVFFFFSGYGLYTSLKSKDNYLKGFLKKRLTAILVPFYVCILIFVTFACIAGQTFNWKEALEVISGWILINSHMWYIVEILILYLAFYFIYRFIKNRAAATAVMAIFVAVLTAGSLLLGHGAEGACTYWFQGEWWYNTTFAFVLGIIVSQNAEKLRSFARKFYWLLLPLFTALTVGFGFLTKYALNTWSYWYEYPGYPGYREKALCLAIQLPWVLFFVVTLLLIMMKIRFGNPILKFLGSISLELYLIHNLFLQGLSKNGGTMERIPSSSLYILLTILISIGFAAVISGFDQYVIRLINGGSAKSLMDSKKTAGRIHSIDVMRIVMAFLVVTIHYPFMGKAGEVFITFGKTAVPFFLVVCGYMLYREDRDSMMKRLKKQAVKIFFLYIGSNVLYGLAVALQEYIAKGNLNGMKVYFTADRIKDFLLYNMWFSEHLWFLGSLFYALIILIVLNKLKTVRYAMFLAPFLIAAYVVLSHLGAAEGYVLRNALLVGLPYTMMGMLIRRYEEKLMKIKAPVLWILAAILCVTAIVELNCWPLGTAVPFISCEILVYVIMLLCLKYPDFGRDTLAEKMGRDLSLPIYILHILPMLFFSMRQGYMVTYGAITVFIITALVSALYVAVKHRITNSRGTVQSQNQ